MTPSAQRPMAAWPIVGHRCRIIGRGAGKPSGAPCSHGHTARSDARAPRSIGPDGRDRPRRPRPERRARVGAPSAHSAAWPGSSCAAAQLAGHIRAPDGVTDAHRIAPTHAIGHAAAHPHPDAGADGATDAATDPVPTPEATPVPPPPGTGNVLPPCAYMDVPALHQDYPDWPITLLDTIYHLPATYAPADLVDSAAAGVNGGYPLRALLMDDLRRLATDARTADAPIRLVSGYRSHAQQQATFDYWVSVGGYEQALRTSARAGHSEHQLGTVIDVTGEADAEPWTYADWASTPAGAWMAANAWRYGFVMSYPRNAFGVTCYDYEPWHYRYVGRALAADITASGLAPRQILWTLQ